MIKKSNDATEFYVYGLFDPRSYLIRYVGYTFNIGQRFTEHLKDSQLTPNTYKNIIAAVVNNRIYKDPNYIYIKPKQIKSPFTEEHKKNISKSRKGRSYPRAPESDKKANNTKLLNNSFRNKLSIEQCDKILEIYNNDKSLTLASLGRLFNVDPGIIRKILRGTYCVLKFRNL